MSAIKPTYRELLLELGIGNFNATQVIPYMEIAPATTDPKSPPVIIMVRALQQVLFGMGAYDIQNTGALDAPTAAALARITGSGWERVSWGGNIQSVLGARRLGMRLSSDDVVSNDVVPIKIPMDGFLPDIPGGMLTYGILGIGAYLWYRSSQRRS